MTDSERDRLFNLYKIALEEYRFEVTLNNDRMFKHLAFNAAALSVGTGLLKNTGTVTNVFVCFLFAAGVMTSLLGIRAIKKGHQYYRRAIYKKTLIETQLGLLDPIDSSEPAIGRLAVDTNYSGATLAIATTVGQSEVSEILQQPEAWINRPLRRGTIVQASVAVLWLLLAANVIAAGFSIVVTLSTLP